MVQMVTNLLTLIDLLQQLNDMKQELNKEKEKEQEGLLAKDMQDRDRAVRK